jgi:hypothetical protein
MNLAVLSLTKAFISFNLIANFKIRRNSRQDGAWLDAY